MRVLGNEQRSWVRGLLPWLVGAAVIMLLGWATLWSRQQEQARRTAETRAEVAEAQLAVAQASLTALTRVQAVASATAAAIARGGEPGPALERALSLVFAVYQEPTQPRQRALAEAMSPEAIQVFRPQIERLSKQALHLAGESSYKVEILSVGPASGDRAEVRTREVWVYDELDPAEKRVRCLREQSEQTYTLRRVASTGGWLVESVELGASQRSDC